MRRSLAAVLAASLILTACGGLRESRLNPFNWFGRSKPVATTLAPEGGYGQAPGDNRVLVDEVTKLEVQRVTGGALISAAGLPPTQGWWDAELIVVDDPETDPSILALRFVVAEPREARRVSTPQSREVTAAIYMSDQKLAEISTILVVGAKNSRTSRR
jgi:hypothetical protein